ncbi:MAG: hypothetical protein R3F21_25055 [Myxococcota bacterium]
MSTPKTAAAAAGELEVVPQPQPTSTMRSPGTTAAPAQQRLRDRREHRIDAVHPAWTQVSPAWPFQ